MPICSSTPRVMCKVGENLKEDYQSFLKYIESNMDTSYTLKHKKIFKKCHNPAIKV